MKIVKGKLKRKSCLLRAQNLRISEALKGHDQSELRKNEGIRRFFLSERTLAIKLVGSFYYT